MNYATPADQPLPLGEGAVYTLVYAPDYRQERPAEGLNKLKNGFLEHLRNTGKLLEERLGLIHVFSFQGAEVTVRFAYGGRGRHARLAIDFAGPSNFALITTLVETVKKTPDLVLLRTTIDGRPTISRFPYSDIRTARYTKSE